MLHNLDNVRSFLRYMIPSCLKPKAQHVDKQLTKRSTPRCFAFFSSFGYSPTTTSYSPLPKTNSPTEPSKKSSPWRRAYISLCSAIFGPKNKSLEVDRAPLLPNQPSRNNSENHSTLIESPSSEALYLLPERLFPDNHTPSPSQIKDKTSPEPRKSFERTLTTFAQHQLVSRETEISAAPELVSEFSGTDNSKLQKNIEGSEAVLNAEIGQDSTEFEGSAAISSALSLEPKTSKFQHQEPAQQPPVNSQFTKGPERQEQSFEQSSEPRGVEISSRPTLNRVRSPSSSQSPVVLTVMPHNHNSLNLTSSPKNKPVNRLDSARFAAFQPEPKTSKEQNDQQPHSPFVISTLGEPVLDSQEINRGKANRSPIGREPGESLLNASTQNGPSPLSVIPEESRSQLKIQPPEDTPSLPSRPYLITSNEKTDPTTNIPDAEAQSPLDFLYDAVTNVAKGAANATKGAANFTSGLITDITKAPLTRLDLDIVSTTNQEEDIFEIKAFNFINEELDLYEQIQQLINADKKINCYNFIIKLINEDGELFNSTITSLEDRAISTSLSSWNHLTQNEMIDLFDQMNRTNLIGAENDDEKVKKLKIIMKILPLYLITKELNIKELLEERNWPELNSININDELKLKALKYINKVSGSNLDISEADQTNNFDYLMSIIEGKSEEIKKEIYNPHNPRQFASDDNEMDRESKIKLFDYLNQRLKIFTINDDDKVQKFNLIARCIKLKRTDFVTLMVRDGYNEVAGITEASKDKLLNTINEAIDDGDDIVSEALKELNESEAGQIAGKALRALEDSEVVREASKAFNDIDQAAASGVKDVETKAIKAGHDVVFGGLDVLIHTSDALNATFDYTSKALNEVDQALASGVNEITRALDDEGLPQEKNSSETLFDELSQSEGQIKVEQNDDNNNTIETLTVAATNAAHSAVSGALTTFNQHIRDFFPATSPKPELSKGLTKVSRTSNSSEISDDLKFRAFQYINDVCKIKFETTEITSEKKKEFIDFFDYMISKASDVQTKILQDGSNTPIETRHYDKSLREEEKTLLFDYLNRDLSLRIITEDKSVKVQRFDAFVNSYKERMNEFKIAFYQNKIEKNTAINRATIGGRG
jgi:hypothetical protein